jgi:hypothetical protein
MSVIQTNYGVPNMILSLDTLVVRHMRIGA